MLSEGTSMTESPERNWSILLRIGHDGQDQQLARSLNGLTSNPDGDLMGRRTPSGRMIEIAQRVSGPDRVLTVIDGRRGPSTPRPFPTSRVAATIEQPPGMGTCPAVYLAAAYVLASDLDATLLLVPTGTDPDDVSDDDLTFACSLARRERALVLVGRKPLAGEACGAWIVPARTPAAGGDDPVRKVVRLQDQASESESAALRRQGAVRDTMVVAATAQALWSLGWLNHPDMMMRFDMLRRVIATIREGRAPLSHEAFALASVYRELDTVDFHRDLLTPSVEALSVLILERPLRPNRSDVAERRFAVRPHPQTRRSASAGGIFGNRAEPEPRALPETTFVHRKDAHA
jgi:hypothetical protein